MYFNERTVFGTFLDNIWRDEKSGHSYFRMKTTNFLESEEMYQKQEVVRNVLTDKDETWFTIVCDASDVSMPLQKKGTPIKVTGYFNFESSWELKATSVDFASEDDNTTMLYLQTFGIEKDAACQLVSKYGSNIPDLVKKKDVVAILSKEANLTEDKASELVKEISTTLFEYKAFRYLSKFNIPYSYACKAVRYYGDKVLMSIKNNPYAVGEKIGLSLEQCDRIAKANGANAFSVARIRFAIKKVFDNLETSGDCFVYIDDFIKIFNKKVITESFGSPIPTILILSSVDTRIYTIDRLDGKEIIYSNTLIEAEKRIAANISRLSNCDSNEPYNDGLIKYAEKVCNMSYGKQQLEAFPMALRYRGVKILTGGPGTGKTTTIKGILFAYKRMHPDHTIRLCAPTGRAAQRMAESTGMPATTIHRLLEYRPFGESASFKDANNPIEADMIVVDEMSMTDIKLFDMLLCACKTGTTLLLVGDINQLESVGPGAVLHDLLQSEESLIKKTLLTEVYRQKGNSPIIDNAIKINKGETNLSLNEEFKIVKTKSEDESLEKIKEIYSGLYEKDNPFSVQVLCPARAGLTGIDNLNKELQELLNPCDERLVYGSTTFRKGDKVIMTRNNPEFDYYNGDIGVIKEICDNSLVVEIRDNEVKLCKDLLDDIKLSYGMTIHKSQGSEFTSIIIVMPMNPKNMLVRNLFYTGVTRAKKSVIIVNESCAMETAIKVNKAGCRKTMLPKYLPLR